MRVIVVPTNSVGIKGQEPIESDISGFLNNWRWKDQRDRAPREQYLPVCGADIEETLIRDRPMHSFLFIHYYNETGR